MQLIRYWDVLSKNAALGESKHSAGPQCYGTRDKADVDRVKADGETTL